MADSPRYSTTVGADLVSARKRLEPRGRTQGPSLRSEYIRGTVEKTLSASGIFKKRYRLFNRTNMFTFNNSPPRGAAVNDSESIYSPPKGGAGGRGSPPLQASEFSFSKPSKSPKIVKIFQRKICSQKRGILAQKTPFAMP